MSYGLFIIPGLLLVLGIVILLGKGDWLIAGYNTASHEERERYNMRRVRGVLGTLMFVVAGTVFLMQIMPEIYTILIAILLFILAFVAIGIINTWGKRG